MIFKSQKINLILILVIVLGAISFFNFTGAATSGRTIVPAQPYVRPACTGTTDCTSWGLCMSGIKTCDSSGYSLTPTNCTGGTVFAPTSTCPASESARSASGYAWSDNIGYISFSGSADVCSPDSPLTQTLSCPTGQTGSITQTRTSTCPGPVTSEWATTSNTCAVICSPDSPLTQTLSCPTGQTGSITQTRTSTCPGPVTSEWATTSNTCISVPDAPTNVVATAGNTQATINFSAPVSNGGSPITSYNVVSNPGSITANGSSGPITLTGLNNFTNYTFSVKAVNVAGAGPAATSNIVTPTLTWSPIMINTWYYANAYCTNSSNGYTRLPTASELQYAMRNNMPNDWPTLEESQTYWRWWTSTLCTSGHPAGTYSCLGYDGTGSLSFGGVITGYSGSAFDEYTLNANLSTRFRCVK